MIIHGRQKLMLVLIDEDAKKIVILYYLISISFFIKYIEYLVMKL